ncbi:MAG: amino acid ABC transporter permease [Clostridiales Family XIII bacterium]|nr:amino acid ABC transporter permease [Clostridiales Family XIII bacterium]
MFNEREHERFISPIELQRREYRRMKTVRSVLISCASFLVFSFLIWWILSRSEGWELVRKMYFDPKHLVASAPQVFKGILVNLKILGAALVGTAVLSTLLAITRTTKSAALFPLRLVSLLYTSIFRGLPMIVVLYLIGFGIPGLNIFGRIDKNLIGGICITLVYSAYVAEVLRAGIEAIHPSQRAAARSLGLSHTQTLRIVILPQAIRKVVPALMNDFVAMQKDVGLVSVVGAVDAVRQAGIYTAKTFNYSSYVFAGLMFICMSLPFVLLTDWYAAKVRRREQMEGAV